MKKIKPESKTARLARIKAGQDICLKKAFRAGYAKYRCQKLTDALIKIEDLEKTIENLEKENGELKLELESRRELNVLNDK